MDESSLHRDLVIPVRIGDRRNVSEGARPWQLEQFVRTERERLLGKLRALERRRPLTPSQEALLEALRAGPSVVERLVLDAANLVCGTTIGILQHPDIKSERRSNGPARPEFDVLIVDEASKTPFQEFLVPALLAKRWVIVGDPKQLSPYVDEHAMAVNVEACLPDARIRDACIDTYMAGRPNSRNRRTAAVVAEDEGTRRAYREQCAARDVALADADRDDHELTAADLVVGTSLALERRGEELPLDVATVRSPEDALSEQSQGLDETHGAGLLARTHRAEPEPGSDDVHRADPRLLALRASGVRGARTRPRRASQPPDSDRAGALSGTEGSHARGPAGVAPARHRHPGAAGGEPDPTRGGLRSRARPRCPPCARTRTGARQPLARHAGHARSMAHPARGRRVPAGHAAVVVAVQPGDEAHPDRPGRVPGHDLAVRGARGRTRQARPRGVRTASAIARPPCGIRTAGPLRPGGGRPPSRSRRARHRQDPDRRDARRDPEEAPAGGHRSLWRSRLHARREPALRTPKGRLHRRRGRSTGTAGGGGRRDPVPRRGSGPAEARATQARPGLPGPRAPFSAAR